MFRVAWWLLVAWAAQLAVFRALGWLGYPGNEAIDELLFYGILYAVTATFCRHHTGSSWADLVPLRGFGLWLLAPVVMSSLGGLIISFQSIAFCMAIAPLPYGVFEAATGASRHAGPAGVSSLLSSLASSAVIAPVFEEALVRGLVLGGLAATMSKRRAIVFSALFFSVMHGALERAPGTFFSGLLYGWMFVQTGSLIPGMIAHGLHNGVCEVLEYSGRFPGSPKSLIGVDIYGMLPAWLVWVAAVLFVAGGILFAKATRRPRPPEPGSADEEYDLAA